MFFLTTADERGQPDVSYTGGAPGFVQILDERTLAFPGYDGNGMFRSLGNVRLNPRVSLPYVDLEQPQRLRILGYASVTDNDPIVDRWPGAQLVVRVVVGLLIPNCSRYIHRMQRLETSPFVPSRGVDTPPAPWKRFEIFRDVLPRLGEPLSGSSPRQSALRVDGQLSG